MKGDGEVGGGMADKRRTKRSKICRHYEYRKSIWYWYFTTWRMMGDDDKE